MYRYGWLNIYVPKAIIGSAQGRSHYDVYFEPEGEAPDGAVDCAIPNSPALVKYLDDWFTRGQATLGRPATPDRMQATQTLPTVIVIGYQPNGTGGSGYQCGGYPCGDSSRGDYVYGGAGSMDPPPACYPDDPTCEQPMTTADQNAFGNAVTKYVKDWSDIPDTSARRECQEMLTKFEDLYTAGHVYRGAYNTPPSTIDPAHQEHFALYDRNTGHMHVDPAFLDSAATPGPRQEYWIRDLANNALHEAAHALGYDHGEPLTSPWGPLYTEDYFNKLQPDPKITCMNWNLTS